MGVANCGSVGRGRIFVRVVRSPARNVPAREVVPMAKLVPATKVLPSIALDAPEAKTA